MCDASEEEHGVVFLVLDEHVDRLAAVVGGEAEVLLCRMVSLYARDMETRVLPEQSISRGPAKTMRSIA